MRSVSLPEQTSDEVQGRPEVGAAAASERLQRVQEVLRALTQDLEGLALEHERHRNLIAAARADLESAGRRLEQVAVGELTAPLPSPDWDEAIPTVLVVDDDASLREALRDLLSDQYRVVVAEDGARAARLVREERPAAIVSDLYMPQADGHVLLDMLRTDGQTADIPLLVLSGYGNTEAKVKAFEAGATDFITKPVAAGELLARVRAAISRSQALRRERALVETDDLTGLANRRALRLFLSNHLRPAGARPLTVAMVDQDGLKQINDRFGHSAGDEAIRTVARALHSCKRASDCAARVGGDEFVVAMPGTDAEGARRFIDRVEEYLDAHPLSVGEDLKLRVGASFGLATAGADGQEGWEELLKRADQLLYDQKRARKVAQAS